MNYLTNPMKTPQTKHTPGPWHVTSEWLNTSSGIYHVAIEASLPNGFGLITSLEHTFDRERQDANARLIAAAPTMFNYLTMLASRGDNEANEIIKSIA